MPCVRQPPRADNARAYAPDRVIVKFKPRAALKLGERGAPPTLAAVTARLGLEHGAELRESGFAQWRKA